MPVGLAVEGANRHDKKLAEATLESIPVERPEPTAEEPQGMCLDKGYDYDDTRELVREFGFTAHVRARGEEAKELKREAGQKARRWVVERTHSWMNRFRRVLIRWEKKVENYFGMLHFVCAWITYRAAGLAFPGPQTQVTFSPGDGGLEREPTRSHAVLLGRLSQDLPATGLYVGDRRGQHGLDFVFPLQCLDVPGEGDQIAPVAFVGKQFRGGGPILPIQGGAKSRQPFGDLSCRGTRKVNHASFPSCSLSGFSLRYFSCIGPVIGLALTLPG